MKFNDNMMSFERIHQANNRATLYKLMIFKEALFLFKLYNGEERNTEWLALDEKQVITSNQENSKMLRANTN